MKKEIKINLNVEKALKLANQLLRKYKLTHYKIVLTDSKKFMGKHIPDRQTIEISAYFINTEPWGVRDTILHEIAHALTIGHGHDLVWVATAKQIGCSGSIFKDSKIKVVRFRFKCKCRYHYLTKWPLKTLKCKHCNGKLNQH